MHADLIAAAHLVAGGCLVPATAPPEALVEALYAWYLNSTPLPEAEGPLSPWEVSLPSALRAAHAGTACFEGGWRAESVSSRGRAVASRRGLTRVLDRAEYVVPARPGLPACPGDALLVSGCWDWVDDHAGFWHARRGVWPPAGADRLVRVYFNSAPASAPTVIRRVTELTEEAGDLSYTVKTPAASNHGGRADAVVLYLGPAGFAGYRERLVRLGAALADHLRPSIPRFTLGLSAGVAMSEGPLSGESFGLTRCQLIARAAGGPAGDAPARVEAIFSAAGLDAERPYLEPGGLR